MNLRKFIFQTPVFIFFIFFNQLFAQEPCNEDIIMAIKGKWAKRPDASMNASNLPQVISRIDKMQKLLQAAYPEPIGIEAGWYRSAGGYNSSVNTFAESYELEALFKTYYCNNNVKKILLGGETANWFYVWVNKFSWFADYVTYFTINQQPVYLLTPAAGELNGYKLYKGIGNENRNTGIKYSRALIITKPGQSPYLSVTRKQFLEAYLSHMKEYNLESLAAFEKNIHAYTDEQEEADKKQSLENIERVTSPDKLARAKENFLKNYITSKQQKVLDIAKIKKMGEEDLKPAQIFLANSTEQELEQPAILDYSNIISFKEFSTDAKGGQQMVRINSDYFNNKLPKYIPQFLIVYWSWNTEKPSIDFANHIENNFNFKALQAMLDK